MALAIGDCSLLWERRAGAEVILPPSFLILPSCCLFVSPLPSLVPPRCRLSPATLQPFRRAAAPALTASRAPCPLWTRKILARDMGIVGMLVGLSPPRAGAGEALGHSSETLPGSATGKMLSAHPSIAVDGSEGGIFSCQGCQASSGREKVAPGCGNCCLWLEELGTKGLIPLLMAGSTRCLSLCLLQGCQQDTELAWLHPCPGR